MNRIDTQQLQSMKSDGSDFLLVNTLDPDDFRQTKIPDSINIPQSQENFAAQVQQAAADKTQPVVVYCGSEDCQSSTKAAKKLDEAGFSNVLDYEGKAERKHGRKRVSRWLSEFRHGTSIPGR
ncbi:MAG: rhodanese-like domain-containing protein [Planctomycetaceae bacterium]